MWNQVFIGRTSCDGNRSLSLKVETRDKMTYMDNLEVMTTVEYQLDDGPSVKYTLLASLYPLSTGDNSTLVYFPPGIWLKKSNGAKQLTLNAGWSRSYGMNFRRIAVGAIRCAPFYAGYSGKHGLVNYISLLRCQKGVSRGLK